MCIKNLKPMQTHLKRFFKHPLTTMLLSWAVPFMSALYLYIAGWLFMLVTLYVWQIIVLSALPLAVLGVLNHIRQRAGRRFGTGDKVQVVGDSRCFVVLDYSPWHPKLARLIEQDKDLMISISERYLSPYQKPDPDHAITIALRSVMPGNVPPRASRIYRL